MANTRVAAGLAIGALWATLAVHTPVRAQAPVATNGGGQAAQQVPPKRPRPPVNIRPVPPTTTLAPPAEAPQTPAPPAPRPEGQGTTRLTADGSIEEQQADGSVRRSKPGVCGWTIIRDGKPSHFACSTKVQKLDLPVPTGDMAGWLDGHADSLLDIARALLGSNADTLAYHVTANEAGVSSVYDRIRLRTSLVETLSAAAARR